MILVLAPCLCKALCAASLRAPPGLVRLTVVGPQLLLLLAPAICSHSRLHTVYRTARGVGNPVSLIAGTSSVSRAGQGWALEGDQNCKSIQYRIRLQRRSGTNGPKGRHLTTRMQVLTCSAVAPFPSPSAQGRHVTAGAASVPAQPCAPRTPHPASLHSATLQPAAAACSNAGMKEITCQLRCRDYRTVAAGQGVATRGGLIRDPAA